MFTRKISSRRKEREAYPMPLPAGMTGGEYLDVIRGVLPAVLDSVRPDLVIYNAGSDPFIDDPLAGLQLTMSDLAERDLSVVSMVRERSIPIAMVLSGGYSSESWKIHAESIEGILTRFDKEIDGVPGCARHYRTDTSGSAMWSNGSSAGEQAASSPL